LNIHKKILDDNDAKLGDILELTRISFGRASSASNRAGRV